jgi:hypothetical protein
MITAEDTVRRTPGLANVRISDHTVRRRLRESGLRTRHSVVGPILKQPKAKWKSGFITKKDVLPSVKPPTTRTRTQVSLVVLWRCLRIGPTTECLVRSPDSRSLLRTVWSEIRTAILKIWIFTRTLMPRLRQNDLERTVGIVQAGMTH